MLFSEQIKENFPATLGGGGGEAKVESLCKRDPLHALFDFHVKICANLYFCRETLRAPGLYLPSSDPYHSFQSFSQGSLIAKLLRGGSTANFGPGFAVSKNLRQIFKKIALGKAIKVNGGSSKILFRLLS